MGHPSHGRHFLLAGGVGSFLEITALALPICFS
jgi:hypothetical protein